MIPSDPYILLSYINTKLRDDFSSLDELCGALDINEEDLTAKLRNAGFEYNQATNQFK